MENKVVRIEGLPDTVTITRTGVAFTGDLAFDKWESLLMSLSSMEVAAQWGIGDALNYGEARYGEKYTQAIELTGHTYQALANYSWVARSIPIENRNTDLSWTHHRVVCKLEHTEQKKLLDEALAKQWSVDVLADVVRGTPLTDPKSSDLVNVPAGLSVTDANKVLETAACLTRDNIDLCPMCPYKRGKE